MSMCKFTAIFPVRKFDRQRKMKNKNKKHHFTKHRNIVNLNSHRSTEQEICEDGTDYTIQTAATRWWKVLANVYQNHHRRHYFFQNLKQSFSFTQILREFSAWITKIENFSWINNSRSVQTWIVFDNITNNSRVKSIQTECEIISLNIVLYLKKLQHFTRRKTHSGSNLLSQVDYIFKIMKSLSIAVFIIKFMFMAQYKYGKYSHYVTWQFCFGWKCFCFHCYKMYFSSLRSRHI